MLPDFIADFYTTKLTVSQLTGVVKGTLEALTEREVTVEGEISTFRPASSGHWYFNLKDDESTIAAVVWRGTASRLGFRPKDGQKVVVTGKLSVYPPSGSYKLICSTMKIAGEGDILAMLEERKRRYAAMGWFEQSLKKPIPSDVRRIGVVTSPTGAAFQDILNVTLRRSPSTDIIIFPAAVQGDGADAEIASRINQANMFGACDVLIVGRGGGSVEDLLPFSSECVIQAIHDSEIPVISAVGHEIDWALSDFVADLRAPTPSAAAELACKDIIDRKETLSTSLKSLSDAMSAKVSSSRLMLERFSQDSARSFLQGKLDASRMRLDNASGQVLAWMQARAKDARGSLSQAKSHLEDLSPLAVLSRGYAIVTDEQGNNIKDAAQTRGGQLIGIRLASSAIRARVEEEDK